MTGTTRQAVLIIHGIGDQKPMETMRGFVKAVWPTSPNAAAWSRPDTLSENFDLRQIVTRDEKTGQRTDFFELYWAHLMEGTKLAGVWAWIWHDLLLRPGRTMPQVIRSAKGFVVAYFVLRSDRRGLRRRRTALRLAAALAPRHPRVDFSSSASSQSTCFSCATSSATPRATSA